MSPIDSRELNEKPMNEASESISREEFVAKCPRCLYELAGLPVKGLCPECGASYDIAALMRAFDDSQRVPRFRPGMAIAITALFTPMILKQITVGLWPSPPRGLTVTGLATCATLAVWGVIFVGWWLYTGRRRRATAEQALVFVVPLIVLFFQIWVNGEALGWMAVPVTIAAMLVWFSLRWAPRVTVGFVIATLTLPGSFYACVMAAHALSRMKSEFYWTIFDRPTRYGWRAMGETECLWASGLLAGTVAVLTTAVLRYAKKSQMRLNMQK